MFCRHLHTNRILLSNISIKINDLVSFLTSIAPCNLILVGYLIHWLTTTNKHFSELSLWKGFLHVKWILLLFLKENLFAHFLLALNCVLCKCFSSATCQIAYIFEHYPYSLLSFLMLIQRDCRLEAPRQSLKINSVPVGIMEITNLIEERNGFLDLKVASLLLCHWIESVVV